MIWTLLSSGIIVIFVGGMILAARVRPHGAEAKRRLEIIRKSSLLR